MCFWSDDHEVLEVPDYLVPAVERIRKALINSTAQSEPDLVKNASIRTARGALAIRLMVRRGELDRIGLGTKGNKYKYKLKEK